MNLIFFDYNFYNFIQIRRIDQKRFQKLRKNTILMEFTNTLFTFSILQFARTNLISMYKMYKCICDPILKHFIDILKTLFKSDTNI